MVKRGCLRHIPLPRKARSSTPLVRAFRCLSPPLWMPVSNDRPDSDSNHIISYPGSDLRSHLLLHRLQVDVDELFRFQLPTGLTVITCGSDPTQFCVHVVPPKGPYQGQKLHFDVEIPYGQCIASQAASGMLTNIVLRLAPITSSHPWRSLAQARSIRSATVWADAARLRQQAAASAASIFSISVAIQSPPHGTLYL